MARGALVTTIRRIGASTWPLQRNNWRQISISAALAKADELKKRIWFTLGALLVYRLGTYIPLPGIDPNIWEQVFRSQAGGILGMFNMFAGGGIHRMAIFALNIMPYISASIIIQLLTSVSPQARSSQERGRVRP